MFRGIQEYNLDEKGRILLPIKYRDELGELVVLSFGGDAQINIWPKSTYTAIEQQLEAAGGNEAFPMASRITSSSVDCEVDRQGRIVVPPVMRRHANLHGEVIILGNRDHVEIWNPDEWQQTYRLWVERFRQTPDDYAAARQAGFRF